MTSKPQTESVTLLRPHRHGGKDRKKGETIQVTASQRERLEARKIIAKREAAK